MSINERIDVFKEHFGPAIEKSELTEKEWFDLIVYGASLFRQGSGITYTQFNEIVREMYVKHKFNLGG